MQVDALSWLGLTVDNVQYALSPEEEEEAEWDEYVKQNADQGRSTTTGY
jgi:hypothetical protein